MSDIVYDYANAHMIGVVMKEAVRRAIMAIRAQRFIFEAKAKIGHSGNLDDMVTSADKEAQDIYVRMLTESFPNYGIVAEEEQLREECTLPGNTNMYFTVDPLDGTKAFVRKQSHGVGTMISLVCNHEVVAAYVGDVMTQEIFGFRPESNKVHRISEFNHNEELTINEYHQLDKQHILLRSDPKYLRIILREMITGKDDVRIFRGFEVTGGSIGTSMARLWKGEVGAAVLRPGYNTPWDWSPIIGISKKLGFVFLRTGGSKKVKRLIKFEPLISQVTEKTDDDVLIIHKSRLKELGDAVL